MRGRGYRVWVIAALLGIVGIALAAYKWRELGFPVLPKAQTEVWTVEVTVSFDAGPGPIKANLYIPGLTPGFAILEENFVSRGFGFTPNYVSGGRQVQWARRRARGLQTLYYRAVIYKDPAQTESDTTPPFPSKPSLGQPFDMAIDVLIDDVRARSADAESFTEELLKRLGQPDVDQNVELLLGPAPTAAESARVAQTLLAAARIPARTIHGIYLQDQQRRAEIVPWLEVHDGTRWLYFDPLTGNQGLPDNFLLWWTGDDDLLEVDGGGDVEIRFAVQRNVMSRIDIAQRRVEETEPILNQFSLFALPIQTQAVYAVLLLIPIGAFVVVLLRNVIGVQTFGTFMPVLIALAFRETQLWWGAVLFSTLVALGLAFRFYLERLRLLLVPRLSAVLIIVVILMLALSIISHRLGFEGGLSVALFPMVIIAMTIERMSVVWEERGGTEAVQQGLGSLLVAVISYAVMDLDLIRHLVFVFPELLLVVLAATILLGRYSGYRLLELYRFRELADKDD
ncbi:MAG: UUP1 family membrane protein [Gammaproteobacteria bacterium]|nr:UUP1 family membrane protein [Gammaproteobacteria bacterium]MBT8445063.1 UUP1 family membrane protein [Gammaproteobacteria bacterium]